MVSTEPVNRTYSTTRSARPAGPATSVVAIIRAMTTTTRIASSYTRHPLSGSVRILRYFRLDEVQDLPAGPPRRLLLLDPPLPDVSGSGNQPGALLGGKLDHL